MLYQVIGVERKTGDFTPKDEPDKKIHYDNIVFHCVTLKRLVGCAGQKAEQCAIKVVDSADMLGSVDAMVSPMPGTFPALPATWVSRLIPSAR